MSSCCGKFRNKFYSQSVPWLQKKSRPPCSNEWRRTPHVVSLRKWLTGKTLTIQTHTALQKSYAECSTKIALLWNVECFTVQHVINSNLFFYRHNDLWWRKTDIWNDAIFADEKQLVHPDDTWFGVHMISWVCDCVVYEVKSALSL